MKRTWKQWWCGLRLHKCLACRIVSGDGAGSYLEHYCPRCGQVLLRLRLP